MTPQHNAPSHVALIIVLYNPQPDDIAHAQKMAASNTGVIIDNSATPAFATDTIGGMHYVCLGKNQGIAYAQNHAIELIENHAEQPCTHYVFLDQDSRTQHDYPQRIAAEYEAAEHALATQNATPQQRLAILGPTIISRHSGKTYSTPFHTASNLNEHFTPQREIISSGACISREALHTIGPLEQQLFIDMVDHEWCWRARSKGWNVGTTPQLTLLHSVGRRPINIAGYTILTAAPQRYFYLWRNYLILRRRKYVPRQWKWATAIKRIIEIIVIPLTQPDGRQALHHMIKGIAAAKHNNTGDK